MHLKTKTKKLKTKIFLFLFIFFFFLILTLKITSNISNTLLEYATDTIYKLVSNVINNSLDEEIINIFKEEEMFNITKNTSDEIEMVDYNSILVNKVLSKVSLKIQDGLLKIDEGDYDIIKKDSDTIFYIPLGVIFNNPLFNNLGPNIPIKIKSVGSVLTNIKTRIKEYGINNSLIEMVIVVDVKEKMILPLVSKEINITNEIPVQVKIIKGNIPNYYGNGIEKNSSIYSIPLQ